MYNIEVRVHVSQHRLLYITYIHYICDLQFTTHLSSIWWPIFTRDFATLKRTLATGSAPILSTTGIMEPLITSAVHTSVKTWGEGKRKRREKKEWQRQMRGKEKQCSQLWGKEWQNWLLTILYSVCIDERSCMTHIDREEGGEAMEVIGVLWHGEHFG